MTTYRSAFALICAVWFLQLGGGILGIVAPLGLETLGMSPSGVGLVAGLHSAGFMAGAAYAPQLIRRVGNIRSFSAAAGVTTIGTLGFALLPDIASWTVIRIVQGAGYAVMFAAIEAWLAAAVPHQNRGGLIGFYHVAAKAALFVGPLLIMAYGPTDTENFLYAAVFFAAALMPICLTRQVEPVQPEFEPLPFVSLLRIAPAGVFGVFMAGVINTGTLALLPLFARTLGPEDDAIQNAVLVYAAANIGGLLLQWPLGWLSDRIDRRTVVAASALFSAAMAGLVWRLAVQIDLGLMLLLIACWGAGSLTFYGLCIAHSIDRAKPHQVTQLMSGLLFVWAAGSVVGPVIVGLGMRTDLGTEGLFFVSALLLALLAIVMIVRRARVEGPNDEAQEDWTPVVPRSVVGGELDPRAEEA